MSIALPKLNADPFALVRSLPTQLIPINQIKVRKGLPTDEIFLSRYKAFLSGKAPIHETRMSLDRIRRGFWKSEDNAWSLIGDLSVDVSIEYAIDMIRLGSRPVLHLYENPNPEDTKRYVCADDTVIHAAYERLGLTVVPVALMGKPRNLEESCLSVRRLPRGRNGLVPLLEGVVPATPALVPSILGVKNSPAADSLPRLLQALVETKADLKRFHRPGANTLHYHHTLYSVLLRAEECVDSIRLLLAADRPLPAVALLRSLYELALIFYVDWLAPAQIYRYLQMASVTSQKDWESNCENWRKDDIAAGASFIEAKNIKDAHIRSFRLGCVVGERARIFPLGEEFQRDIYSFLSDVIHHDFSMTARYSHTLDHGDNATYHEDATDTLVHIADLLVAAMVSRVRADIGLVGAIP